MEENMQGVDLSVNFLGFQLKNPLIAAPGPYTRDYQSVARLVEAGIAAVITKTILLKPSANPRPCLYRGAGYFLNTERCSTLPLSQWLERELPLMAELKIPIIASIGMSRYEVAKLAKRVVSSGANALELAIFTPYDDPSPIVEAVKAVKDQVEVPVIVKLSCNVHDLVDFGLAVKEAGADAVSAIDAVKAGLAIDPKTGRPALLEQGFGRISGEAIKPLALYHVAQLVHYVGLPVIGIGGVFTAQDVVDMIYCGASAVGLCTALIVNGPDVIRVIIEELGRILRALGILSIEEIRGKALQTIDFPESVEERREYEKRVFQPAPIVADIDVDRCILCGSCKKICLYDAIRNVNNKYEVNKDKCEGCGLCVSLCPVNAIKFINRRGAV